LGRKIRRSYTTSGNYLRMRVLVTGATGFIGGYVISELIKRNIDVVASSTSIEKARQKEWFNKVTFIEHNLTSPHDNLVQYFSNPDVLIHLAWRGLPNYKELFHIEEELMVQYSFLKQLIEEGLTNINITGTCFEYGMQEGCLNEETTIADPANSYSLAKDTLRKFLFLLKDRYRFSIKWYRLFYMYGEGQNEKSILSQLEQALESNDSSFNMSLGEQRRDYSKVEDMAKYLVDCSLQNETEGIINLSSNSPIKIKDLVNKYLTERNKSIYLNLGFYPYPDYEPFAFWGDNSKLKKIIHNYESN